MTDKRAVIYCRVSTDEQAAKGYSLPTQVEACEQYAYDQGFEVVGRFKDDYTGTVPIEDRPEGRKVYDLLRSSQADVLIAYRIDRLVRPPQENDEWFTPVLILSLAKLSKEIHVCDRGQLHTDFASLLIAMLDAKGAGDERRKIIERTTRGRNQKARQGKVVGSGSAPYGYAFPPEKNTFIINEREAAIVRQMYQWYVFGEGEQPPLTYVAIARQLCAMGVKTPGETRGGTRRIRESGMWSFCTVRSILTNETYAGVWHYGRTGTFRKGEKRDKRADDQLVAVSVPPIVDRDLWNAAQSRRSYNKEMSARNAKRDYLLRGLIICSCGRKMIGMFTSGLRYRCSCESTFRRGMDYEQRDCHEKTVNGERLEAVTWQYVTDILTDPVRFESEWRKAQQAEIVTYAPKRERLEIVEALICETSEEAERTVREMSEYKETERERQSYKALRQQRDRNDDRYAKLSAERDRLAAELEAASRFTDEALSRAMQFRADIFGGLKHPTFEDKRQYLELLQVRVKVANGKAVIRCALPADAIEADLTSGLTSILFEVSSAFESEEGEFTDMKVLLKHDVPKLGKAGQVKNVANGYARNYLIPQGVAVLATPGAMKQADALAKAEQIHQAQLASDASALAEVLKATTLTFTARAGEGGKLYGSITSQQIADELKAKAGLEVDKRKIELREPIRSLGTHKVAVHLASELQPELTVNVVSDEVVAEVAA